MSTNKSSKENKDVKKHDPLGNLAQWFEKVNWDEWVGQKLLQKLGMLIVLIGMAAFLKYSFDNGWIGPHEQIAISAAVACMMLFAGEFFQKRYPQWFQAFTGGGLALLYFTVWAAHDFYAGDLAFAISPLTALFLYSAITAVGALASIKYRSQTIAWFVVVGGYATPMLVEGANNPMGLIAYLSVLAAGLVVLAWHQKWQYLNIAAFLFAQAYLWWLIYPLPVTSVSDMMQIGVAMGFFVLFGSLPLLHQIHKSKPTGADDIALIIGNGLAVFFPVVDALGGFGGDYAGLACLWLAAVYGILATLTLRKAPKDNLLINTYLSGAIGLAALALFIELELEYIAGGWAALSSLLLFVSLHTKRKMPFQSGAILMAASLLLLIERIPAIDPLLGSNPYTPFISSWSVQCSICLLALACWIWGVRNAPQSFGLDKVKNDIADFLHVVAAIVLFSFFAINTCAIGVPGVDYSIDIYLIAGTLAFCAVSFLIFSLTRVFSWFVGILLAQAFILLSVFVLSKTSGMNVFIGSVPAVPIVHPWALVSLISFGITIALLHAIPTYKNIPLSSQEIRTPLIALALLHVFLHVSVEIHIASSLMEWGTVILHRVLGAWWMVFALILSTVGLRNKQYVLYQAGVILLAIPLLKDIAMIEMGNTNLIEAMLWTIIPLSLIQGNRRQNTYTAAMDIILLIMIASYAVLDCLMFIEHEYSHTIWWSIAAFACFVVGKYRKMDPLSTMGCIMLAGLAIFDFSHHLSANIQGVWQSSWWAVAALTAIGIGFRTDHRTIRKIGILLFLATAAKLLIVDFALLSPGIRIAASIITGLTMIGASYLYQRFGGSIMK